MEACPRYTAGIIAKIDHLRDELIRHFERLVGHTGVTKTDRSTTAITQYEIQVETAALIRAAEDIQILIRQLQEMWLFGSLNTIGKSDNEQQTDENAKTIAGLLKPLVELQQETAQNGVNGTHLNVSDKAMENGTFSS